MLRDLYERILKQSRKERPVVTVHEMPETTTCIVHGENGYGEMESFDNPPLQFTHTMNSLDDLIAFLNSEHAGAMGCVFVSESNVEADLNYQQHGVKSCRLNLTVSEEFAALNKMEFGVGQQELWRLLVTKLAGCVDDALLLSVRNVAVHATNKDDVQIDNSGVVSGSSGSHVKVSMQGGSTEQIRVDWTAKVSIWECFDLAYEIQLRLVISLDMGLKFTFHRVRLDNVMRQARADLVGLLKAGVKNFDVFDGELGEKPIWTATQGASNDDTPY